MRWVGRRSSFLKTGEPNDNLRPTDDSFMLYNDIEIAISSEKL